MFEDPLDSWSGAVGDRAVAIAAAPSPYWIQLAQQGALLKVDPGAMDDITAGRLGGIVFALAHSAARLGFATRRAECEALGLHEGNPDVAGLLEEFYAAHGHETDWWGTISTTAVRLMKAARGGTSDPRVHALLAPTGMGHEARQRLGAATVASILRRPEVEAQDLGGVDEDTFVECWLFGYYLSACAASLPRAALAHLPDEAP